MKLGPLIEFRLILSLPRPTILLSKLQLVHIHILKHTNLIILVGIGLMPNHPHRDSH